MNLVFIFLTALMLPTSASEVAKALWDAMQSGELEKAIKAGEPQWFSGFCKPT